MFNIWPIVKIEGVKAHRKIFILKIYGILIFNWPRVSEFILPSRDDFQNLPLFCCFNWPIKSLSPLIYIYINRSTTYHIHAHLCCKNLLHHFLEKFIYLYIYASNILMCTFVEHSIGLSEKNYLYHKHVEKKISKILL